MPDSLIDIVQRQDERRLLFWGMAAVVLVSLFAAIVSEYYFLAALPALLVITFLTIVDLRLSFFLLMAAVPLSTELFLPGGLGTDLPTEPMMIGLMFAFLLFLIQNGRSMDAAFWRHPLTILLFAHFSWTLVATITSESFLISMKFVLAKTWYIVTFFLLAVWLLRRPSDLKSLFWFIFIPLTLTVLVTLIRHSFSGFSFAQIHQVLHPFYRNHVAYAAILIVFFPFLWFARNWYPAGSFQRRLLTFSMGFYLLAIYLSYTRAAYIALLIALGAYFIIRWRLTLPVLITALIGLIATITFLANDNRYLELAPNYERTITHKNFENLLEATYEGTDISTMERVYRWVAGFHMGVDQPLFGFGPGNFFFFYKPYTVTSFQTYVSDNPERSGIHSYYLMLLVEQGFPGLLIFLVLVCSALLLGEQGYHALPQGQARQAVMTALLSLVIILALLIINDLVETDKIGPFFFINLALLVNFGNNSTQHPAYE